MRAHCTSLGRGAIVRLYRAGTSGHGQAMSLLRRLFMLAFWSAVIFAYVAAILPAVEAPRVGTWDKLNHMIAFFTITFLGRAAYPRFKVIPLFGLIAGFGALIEISQAIPIIHRDAELADWFADILATVVALVLAWPFAILAEQRRARQELTSQ
jgi:VanZ family protein